MQSTFEEFSCRVPQKWDMSNVAPGWGECEGRFIPVGAIVFVAQREEDDQFGSPGNGPVLEPARDNSRE